LGVPLTQHGPLPVCGRRKPTLAKPKSQKCEFSRLNSKMAKKCSDQFEGKKMLLGKNLSSAG